MGAPDQQLLNVHILNKQHSHLVSMSRVLVTDYPEQMIFLYADPQSFMLLCDMLWNHFWILHLDSVFLIKFLNLTLYMKLPNIEET